jgi:hypothetical protein
VQRTHLLQQFAHVLRAGAGCRLVGHGTDPLDEVVAEEAAESHQHQRHGTVAADPVAPTLVEGAADHIAVDRIENDHRLVMHAQR